MALDIKVPVLGGGAFSLRRIYCVGRNYRAHVVEMGGDPDRELPFYFTKPVDAVMPNGSVIPYPPMTKDFHHEVELVVAIGEGGSAISPETACKHIFGYAVGVDLTRRDLQLEARKAGRPWDMGKAFDASAPCGALTKRAEAGPMETGAIVLSVNGEVRQKSDLSLLIWSATEVVADLSRYVELRAGDLIYTGTPEGVGALLPGDKVAAGIEGLSDLEFEIAAR